MSDSDRPQATTVLTGASGVVGRALLATAGTGPLTALVHSTPVPAGTETVRVDLTRPLLGLDRGSYRALCRRAGAVVHAAALTRFTEGADAIRAVNVAGTRRMLQFAADAGVPFHFIGTAFVDLAGGRQGLLTDYLDSKREAEAAVRAAGVDHRILRLPVTIGHSVTGEIPTPQGFHRFMGAFLRGRLPLLPARPDFRCDLLPSDYLARCVWSVVRRPAGGADRELWLTAGPAALTLAEMLETVLAAAAEAGLPVAAPKLMAPEAVDRLLRPVFLEHLPGDMGSVLEQLTAITSAIARPAPFPSSVDRLVADFGAPPLPDLRAALAANARCWLATRGPAAQPVPARMPVPAGVPE